MPVIFDLSPGEMDDYKQTLHFRRQRDRAQLRRRRAQAWEVARQASEYLKESYHAEQVLVFGSLVHELWFSHASDIDLAVTGVEAEHHYAAVASLQDLSAEFKIDLVRLEACGSSLREAILHAGRPL